MPPDRRRARAGEIGAAAAASANSRRIEAWRRGGVVGWGSDMAWAFSACVRGAVGGCCGVCGRPGGRAEFPWSESESGPGVVSPVF